MKRTILAIAASVMIAPAIADTGGIVILEPVASSGLKSEKPRITNSGGAIIKPTAELYATTGGGDQGGPPAAQEIASSGGKGSGPRALIATGGGNPGGDPMSNIVAPTGGQGSAPRITNSGGIIIKPQDALIATGGGNIGGDPVVSSGLQSDKPRIANTGGIIIKPLELMTSTGAQGSGPRLENTGGAIIKPSLADTGGLIIIDPTTEILATRGTGDQGGHPRLA
ncbi:hypothetical protein [Pseudoalteromonas rubra]|uniref:hypothetical protein n=1 Tax=Pseudoalteromonas rubra TaxID=43658 RepID=UPI000F79DDDB|nr:hypothetical protein [Pseudoalteromonas rubra]